MIVTKKINKDKDILVTTVQSTGEIKDKVNLKDLVGKNGLVLFFYPKDFTFVCPTEIISFDHKLEEFKALGYNVVGASTDNEYSHLAWMNQKVEEGGIGKIKYPLISDIKKELSRDLDILFDDSVALRATFVLDKDLVVRHATINDLPLGRNVDETLRMCDALNFFNEHGEVCPAGWAKGKSGMKANPDGVKNYLKNNASKL